MPVSTSTGPDPDKPSAPSESALVPLARAEENEMMEDVAEMAGGGQVSGQDALTNLETTLKPVEKYAVRFLEEVRITRLSSATGCCCCYAGSSARFVRILTTFQDGSAAVLLIPYQ